MALSELISAKQLRSILTVSQSDLPDSIIADYGLEDDIALILYDAIPDWETRIVDGRPKMLLRVFVKYKAAAILAATAPVFILKKKTDGNNEGQRSDRDGFLWLEDRLNAKANKALADLLEELDIEVYSGDWDLVGISTPARDVITQPREVQE